MNARRPAVCSLATIAVLCGAAPAVAHAGPTGGAKALAPQSPRAHDSSEYASASGGTQSPSAPLAGGVEYGVSASVPAVTRPIVNRLNVPASAVAGRPPRVTFSIDERAVGTVEVRVTVSDLSTRKAVVVVDMGWVRTGRTLTVGWPRGVRLAPGSYHVSLAAHDHRSGTLLRRAHSSGVAALTVTAPVSLVPPLITPPAGAPEAGVPTPAQTAADGAVFPVTGAHTFGGPEDRFGAPRGSHVHEGQDVLTAEGTPVLAPLAGTILQTSYQAGGAGYYAVERTGIGLDFVFDHCKAGSLAVGSGQLVSAGTLLCAAGQSGDATGPHLHFEMWVGGWQSPTGHPIDPLAYLQAWDHAGPGG